MHPRTILRNKIKEFFVASFPGVSILINEDFPQKPEVLSSIRIIFSDSESVERGTNIDPVFYERVLPVAITAAAKGDSSDKAIENAEALAWQIENLLGNNSTLGGLVDEIKQTGLDTEVDRAGQFILGLCHLSFNIEYRTDMVSTVYDGPDATINTNIGV